ncbi:MAG: hypothetical protein ABH952_00605 [Candidatus Omnitrophota bacterium]
MIFPVWVRSELADYDFEQVRRLFTEAMVERIKGADLVSENNIKEVYLHLQESLGLFGEFAQRIIAIS